MIGLNKRLKEAGELVAAEGPAGTGLFASEAMGASTPVWRFTAPFDLDFDPALLEG